MSDELEQDIAYLEDFLVELRVPTDEEADVILKLMKPLFHAYAALLSPLFIMSPPEVRSQGFQELGQLTTATIRAAFNYGMERARHQTRMENMEDLYDTLNEEDDES